MSFTTRMLLLAMIYCEWAMVGRVEAHIPLYIPAAQTHKYRTLIAYTRGLSAVKEQLERTPAENIAPTLGTVGAKC